MPVTETVKIHFSDYQADKDYSLKFSEYPYRRLIKRSIDSRHKQVYFVLRYALSKEPFNDDLVLKSNFKRVYECEKVHIIGAGPAGYFAALRCLELGKKPVLFDRGKSVKNRRRDLVKITREHEVDANSNYCFGEGGAGTYSDGKLYTRSKKRGNVFKVLSQLVEHGADEDIIIDAHPHIGTNKLPGIIQNIRERIEANGGEVHFESKLQDFNCHQDRVEAILINEDWISVKALIVATGHSARDVFELFQRRGIEQAFKPFAMGFRIEHPQAWINNIQYHGFKSENLPSAAYSLVCQAKGKGVFSFCMCPGGIVAPCATNNGEIVTNGWSPSKRDNFFANSGLVSQVDWDDLKDYHEHGVMAGLAFQKQVEQKAWEMAGKMQKAPAQMAKDFLNNRKGEIRESSYLPGLVANNLNHLYPSFLLKPLKEALKQFDKKMPGFIEMGQLIAPETRTSSPLQAIRDKELLHSPNAKNLFPCGEGAGYAGGIVSAAIDGIRCAEAACNSYE